MVTPPWPSVSIQTSPLLAIPRHLVIFDYHERGSPFGYKFTRHFGDREDGLPYLTHMGRLPSARQSPSPFHFVDVRKRTRPMVRLCVSSVGKSLSSHIILERRSAPTCLVSFGAWLSLLFWSAYKLSGSQERHVIMYMTVDSEIPPCYMYVHEDAVPPTEATRLAT